MLREDKKATIYYRFPFKAGLSFRGTGLRKNHYLKLDKAEFEQAKTTQSQIPCLVVRSEDLGRSWWWFEETFYYSDDSGLDSSDVLALVRDKQRRQQRQVQRAHDLLSAEAAGPRREPITRDIRRAVFDRDGGKCVECGSNFDLQYDHILPVAHGGATTIENLQILCSDCNRRKSDSI